MNFGKVSKVEYPNRRIPDSFSNSKASPSKSDITPKESKVKNSSNPHLNEVKSRSLKSKKEVKNSGVSSSNTSRKGNASCGGFLCSFSGSKSNADKGKKKVQEINHGQSDRLQSNPTESCKAQPMPATKSHTQKTASPEDLGICNPKSKVHKNPTESCKAQPMPAVKSHTQKTASPEDLGICNTKTKVHKNQITKDLPPSNPRKKLVSTDSHVATRNKETRKIQDPKASLKMPIPKPNDPEASRKEETPKVPVSKVVRKTDKKNNPSPSRYESYSDTPIHHIRWEGYDNKQSGYECSLCSKDLLCPPHDDDYGSDDDYAYYEEDEYDYEYGYQIRDTPQLLPAVDILSCGHAFHSKCAESIIPDEQSTDPQCFLCLTMSSFSI